LRTEASKGGKGGCWRSVCLWFGASAAFLLLDGCSTRVDDPGNEFIAFVGALNSEPGTSTSPLNYVCTDLQDDAKAGGQRLSHLSATFSGVGVQGENYPDEMSSDRLTRNITYTRLVPSSDKIATHGTQSLYVVRMVREERRWKVCDAHEATQAEIDAAESRRRALEGTGSR
jgi:hypothetical protein